jgi:SEC-C motif-containing protein
MTNTEPCPCGQPRNYQDCCGKYIEGGVYPQDPESLMRSRYTAFAKHQRNYLIKTWHPKTCPPITQQELQAVDWLKLEVFSVKNGLKKATVAFEATYRENDKTKSFKEHSLFRKLKNRWVYFGEEAN